MSAAPLSRRRFLTRATALGCSLAASPLVTPVTMASAPWDNRLVVIILRGGMDGLDVVQPLGAPEFRQLRAGMDPGQTADAPAPQDLDGFFALHQGLADLMPFWHRGELGFVHAVSTPYRDKRSHFEGQDILEAGTGPDDPRGIRDGWLNRLLQHVPGIEAETAFAIGRSDMLLTRGPAPVANWSPDAAFTLSPQARLLLEEVMHDDPLFRDTMLEAMALSDGSMPASGSAMPDVGMGDMRQSMQTARQSGGTADIARFAADKLRGDTRIAAFSLNGFDTHARQINTLPRALSDLQTAILTLREGLGAIWDRTTVVAMTEFGRTARLNGTRGTDHGTGGAMLLAGGALRGGRVIGDWPGLSEADLYERRDLRPTRDVRAHAAWIMRQSFGLERATLQDAVFPGVDMGPDPRLLL
ncbi:hypothetical protein RA2_00068 [Roseovarius sp. A-2]|uniref:DUF1501 domain-containing protein n=1 Tax=Roseovarius sp. A-2 TaxID=1570360 RepID=UPI0009B50D40|nr:DUF1501 domain-containing protein [Roseovarius sp. A-2]GAW33032.1 hypothetical protein RA2_00068 [Roseovarius sp. A-2]